MPLESDLGREHLGLCSGGGFSVLAWGPLLVSPGLQSQLSSNTTPVWTIQYKVHSSHHYNYSESWVVRQELVPTG